MVPNHLCFLVWCLCNPFILSVDGTCDCLLTNRRWQRWWGRHFLGNRRSPWTWLVFIPFYTIRRPWFAYASLFLHWKVTEAFCIPFQNSPRSELLTIPLAVTSVFLGFQVFWIWPHISAWVFQIIWLTIGFGFALLVLILLSQQDPMFGICPQVSGN